jgi:hypothetical protein
MQEKQIRPFELKGHNNRFVDLIQQIVRAIRELGIGSVCNDEASRPIRTGDHVTPNRTPVRIRRLHKRRENIPYELQRPLTRTLDREEPVTGAEKQWGEAGGGNQGVGRRNRRWQRRFRAKSCADLQPTN